MSWIQALVLGAIGAVIGGVTFAIVIEALDRLDNWREARRRKRARAALKRESWR